MNFPILLVILLAAFCLGFLVRFLLQNEAGSWAYYKGYGTAHEMLSCSPPGSLARRSTVETINKCLSDARAFNTYTEFDRGVEDCLIAMEEPWKIKKEAL